MLHPAITYDSGVTPTVQDSTSNRCLPNSLLVATMSIYVSYAVDQMMILVTSAQFYFFPNEEQAD